MRSDFKSGREAVFSEVPYVILVLVLGGFIALSLANAIFVDEMVSDNNDDLMREVELLKQQNEKILSLLEKENIDGPAK